MPFKIRDVFWVETVQETFFSAICASLVNDQIIYNTMDIDETKSK